MLWGPVPRSHFLSGDRSPAAHRTANYILGYADIVDIIVKIPGVDFSVKTEGGETLAQLAVRRGDVRNVEILSSLEMFDCWNVPDKEGDTPVMKALNSGNTKIVEILVGCPRVDLTIRDKEGWTLVMRTIASKKLGEC